MRRILIILAVIIWSFFLFPSCFSVSFAQSPTSPRQLESGDPIGDFFRNLVNSLTGGNMNVPKEVRNVNKMGLPLSSDVQAVRAPTPSISGSTQNQALAAPISPAVSSTAGSSDAVNDAASEYVVACARTTGSCETSTDTNDFFSQFLASLTDAIGISDIGSKKAKEYAARFVPFGIADNMLSQRLESTKDNAVSFQTFKGDETDVLGIGDASENAMPRAIGFVQCSKLPFGFGDCLSSNTPLGVPNPLPTTPVATETPTPTLTPTVTPPAYPTISQPVTTPVPSGVLVYYSQRDPLYKDHRFDSCTIYKGGCGPTTVAMILSTYKNRFIYTPDNVVDGMYAGNTSCSSSIGQAMIILSVGFGFKTTVLFSGKYTELTPLMIEDMKNYIRQGSQIMAAADIFGIGHFFWITDVDNAGNVFVMDPWYGFKRAYPMNQREIMSKKIYKAAFAFRKQ